MLEVVGATLVPVAGVRPYVDLKVGEAVYTLGAPSGLVRRQRAAQSVAQLCDCGRDVLEPVGLGRGAPSAPQPP